MRDKEAEQIIKKLCDKLKHIRQKSGHSIEGLSVLTGLSTSTISQIENQKSTPNMLTCLRICRVLDIKLSELLQSIDS